MKSGWEIGKPRMHGNFGKVIGKRYQYWKMKFVNQSQSKACLIRRKLVDFRKQL